MRGSFDRQLLCMLYLGRYQVSCCVQQPRMRSRVKMELEHPCLEETRLSTRPLSFTLPTWLGSLPSYHILNARKIGGSPQTVIEVSDNTRTTRQFRYRR